MIAQVEIPDDVLRFAREALATEFEYSMAAFPSLPARVRRGEMDSTYEMKAIVRALMADRASRPAAPATDAEGEPIGFQVWNDSWEDWLTTIHDRESATRIISEPTNACSKMRPVYTRSAPAPQAVEEVRREAEEDERDSLFEQACKGSDRQMRNPEAIEHGVQFWLHSRGAMLPADRQRDRDSKTGGA